jgi:hypothetical protein
MTQTLSILSTVGRKAAKPPEIVALRELSDEDLDLVLNPPPAPKGPPGASSLAKLRSTHHALARLIASGISMTEVSEISGYTPSRISVLKADPAFAELVAYYQSQNTEVFIDAATRLKAVGLLALEEVHSRIEEEPEKISFGQLLEVVNSTIGPKAKAGGVAAAGGGGSSPAVALNITFTSPTHNESGVVVEGKIE